MTRAGVSLREADGTELGMYLRILARAGGHKKDRAEAKTAGSGKEVITLRRGTIDEFWG